MFEFTINDFGRVVFAAGLFAYWIGVFIILYHLIRFGVSEQPKKIAIIFLVGAMMLTLISSLLVFQIDFSALINLQNINLNLNIFN